MNKYRFKSENHKQEFLNSSWDFEDEMEFNYNESICKFLDTEGIEEFYVDETEDHQYCIMIEDDDGDFGIAEIIHIDKPLLFHFYPEDVHHYLEVV